MAPVAKYIHFEKNEKEGKKERNRPLHMYSNMHTCSCELSMNPDKTYRLSKHFIYQNTFILYIEFSNCCGYVPEKEQ